MARESICSALICVIYENKITQTHAVILLNEYWYSLLLYNAQTELSFLVYNYNTAQRTKFKHWYFLKTKDSILIVSTMGLISQKNDQSLKYLS